MKYRVLQTDKDEFYPQYRWNWIPFYWVIFSVSDDDYFEYFGSYYQSYDTYGEAVDAIDNFIIKNKKESDVFKPVVYPYESKTTSD